MNTDKLKLHYSNSYLDKTFLSKDKSHSITITSIAYGDMLDNKSQIVLNYSTLLSKNGVIQLSVFEKRYII